MNSFAIIQENHSQIFRHFLYIPHFRILPSDWISVFIGLFIVPVIHSSLISALSARCRMNKKYCVHFMMLLYHFLPHNDGKRGVRAKSLQKYFIVLRVAWHIIVNSCPLFQCSFPVPIFIYITANRADHFYITIPVNLYLHAIIYRLLLSLSYN